LTLPVTIKDIFETAGLRTTAGYIPLKDYIPQQDATIVGRLRSAGAIPEVPGMPICLRQMMTVGCFARSIADLQLCFELIVGADPRRPDVPPVPLDLPSGKSLAQIKIQS
jgi:Asp-tRNA(Asn)/Glu-tRNA(Gln) amidotransferase A subunit family amidase